MASNSSPQISGGVNEYFLTRSDYSKRTDAGAGCGAARTAEDQHIAHNPPKRPRFVYLRTASQSRVALNAVLANCRDTDHVQLPLANAFGTVLLCAYAAVDERRDAECSIQRSRRELWLCVRVL